MCLWSATKFSSAIHKSWFTRSNLSDPTSLNFRIQPREQFQNSLFFVNLKKWDGEWTWLFLFQNHPQRNMTRKIEHDILTLSKHNFVEKVASSGIWTRTFGAPVRRSTYWAIESTGIGAEFLSISSARNIFATTQRLSIRGCTVSLDSVRISCSILK